MRCSAVIPVAPQLARNILPSPGVNFLSVVLSAQITPAPTVTTTTNQPDPTPSVITSPAPGEPPSNWPPQQPRQESGYSGYGCDPIRPVSFDPSSPVAPLTQ